MRAIQSRLENIEKRYRRQCLLTYALLHVVGVVVFSGAMKAEPSTVRATRIEIVDEDGVSRVVVGKTGESGELTS